jgi:hypothetical protein
MALNFVGRIILVFLSLSLLLPLEARAYLYPLSDESIREAYFFGRSANRQKVLHFLANYILRIEPPIGTPNVREIELHTPYEQVVQRSWENFAGYSAQQAQKDYASGPGLIKVRVLLFLDSLNPGPGDIYSDSRGRILDRRENFWREFRFRVIQGHLIEPRRVEGVGMYSRRGRGLTGAEVVLEFDANEFASRSTRVEIIAPSGQTAVAEFALDELK